MAASYAGSTHPAALEPAVPLDRFVRVMRAGRVVAAGGRQNLGESHLVTTDQEQKKPRHELSDESLRATSEASAFRSANETSSAAGRAISTTSNGIPWRVSGESPPARWFLATSRRRRRARLRSTEPLIVRLTVTPTRLEPPSFGTAKATIARPL